MIKRRSYKGGDGNKETKDSLWKNSECEKESRLSVLRSETLPR